MKTNRHRSMALFSTRACVILLETLLTVLICGTDSKTLALANNGSGWQYSVGSQILLSVDEVPNSTRRETAEEKRQNTTESTPRTTLPFKNAGQQNGEGVLRPERTKPFVMVRGERKTLKEALQNGHPEKLQCGFEIGGSEYMLDLEKNKDLLPSPPAVFYYPANSPGVTQDRSPVTHCYYHGLVQGFPQSRVALSTCSGLRGVVVINSTLSFELEPEDEEDADRAEEEAGARSRGMGEGVHVLHPTQRLGSGAGTCGVSHHAPVPPKIPAQMHRSKRDILRETKYIELVLVVNHKEYLNYEKNNKTIIYRMLDIANQVDWFYRPLGVRVALLGLEVWNDGDRIQVDGSPADTLDRFLDWRARELLPRLRHDNAQLVLGDGFDGRTVGMASQSSMCSPGRSGGISVDNLVSVLGVASTVAHELGHNLGMLHDTADRRCQCKISAQQGGCIMEPSTGFMPGQMFSSCSARDLSLSLLHGGGACLFNVPLPERLLGGPRCGNLYVEKGEECDCGLTHECKDPCCNAATCKLVPGAQCSSDGICCDSCKLRPAGWDGQPCEGGGAYCSSGFCASLDSQCRDLWGSNSTQAPEVCFSSVNKLGNKYGNCGRMPNGTYVPCSESDVHCGKIQCQGGNDRPLLGTRAQILTTTVRRNQSELICRATYFDLGDDVSDPATVAEGTACAPGKACVNRRCRDVAVFGVEECQRKCNGHGVCNSNRNCHCDVGWAPPDCKYSGHGGSVDSGPIRNPRGSDATRVVLLVIFLVVLPGVLLFLLIRYPRLRQRLLCLHGGPFVKGPSRQQSRTPASERADTGSGDQVQPLRSQVTPQSEIPLSPPSGKAEERPLPPNKPLPPDPVSKSTQSVGERPRPPTKPLPPDPVPIDDKTRVPARPPPPVRQLPADPASRPVSGVPPHHAARGAPAPKYAPGIATAPTRPAPPPPPPQKVMAQPKTSHSPQRCNQ
ncbi:hypothetical protein AGOR_G00034590 [Albula goreensis]|uniref:Disintegrin and metalloproteinase domain-containing protein 15-like n=1 Tax=Albula goreensis TaxID=1534307 RepID=A0A8T3DWI6_9TELE|nr:hypothetical protein AGOR_G00034590 [Albula goreensis]